MPKTFTQRIKTSTAAIVMCGIAAVGMSTQVQAGTVVSRTVAAQSADYLFFDFLGGALAIQIDANLTSGSPLGDPEIFLFTDDGSSVGNLTGALVASDDDNGAGLNSFISGTFAADSYVLAVSRFDFTEAEARSGINLGLSADEDYVGIFSSDLTFSTPSAVPLPAGLPLLLAGLGALGIARRRKATA